MFYGLFIIGLLQFVAMGVPYVHVMWWAHLWMRFLLECGLSFLVEYHMLALNFFEKCKNAYLNLPLKVHSRVVMIGMKIHSLASHFSCQLWFSFNWIHTHYFYILKWNVLHRFFSYLCLITSNSPFNAKFSPFMRF